MKTFPIEEIKQNLIKSCIHLNAFHFLPYPLSPTVTVAFPNKIRFYGFLKTLLDCAAKDSRGKLEIRIERESWTRKMCWLLIFRMKNIHNSGYI